MTRLRDKLILRRTNGFTLTEALVALLLVGLLGTIIVAGIPVARSVYENVRRRENAEMLCSTLTNRIAGELRDATEFQAASDGRNCFVSHSGSALDGLRISLSATSDDETHPGRVVVTFYAKDGATPTPIVGGGAQGQNAFAPELLLPESEYVLDLNAWIDIAPNATENPTQATVTVGVYHDDPAHPLAQQDITVALAPTTATGGA